MKINAINTYTSLNNTVLFTGKKKKNGHKHISAENMLMGSLAAAAVLNSCSPYQELYRRAECVKNDKTINLTTCDASKFDFERIMLAMPSLFKEIGLYEDKDSLISIIPMQIEYKNKNDIVVTYFPDAVSGSGIWTPDGDAGRIDNLTQRVRKNYKNGQYYIQSIDDKEARKKEEYVKYFAKLTGCTPDKVNKIVVADFLNNDMLNLLIEKKDGTTLYFDLNNEKIEDWSEFNRYEYLIFK